MPSGKSEFAVAVDVIQRRLRPCLQGRGFKARGRTFNRVSEDGLTQVVNIQMGSSDPPGTTYIAGLRDNMHGLFTVNLGVYVPEVTRLHGGSEARSWVQEYHCCVRSRLGEIAGDECDSWWPARAEDSIVDDVVGRLEKFGFPFLARFGSRDKILAEWAGRSQNSSLSVPPRIVSAIILAARSQRAEARDLLRRQAEDSRPKLPGHSDYVAELAARMGLGTLDG